MFAATEQVNNGYHYETVAPMTSLPGLLVEGTSLEAEQFQVDPGKVFGFAGMIFTGREPRWTTQW